MSEEKITVEVSGKANIGWIRRKIEEGNYSTESEAVTDSVAILREEQEFAERELKEQLAANLDEQGNYCGPTLSIEEVKHRLEVRRT